MPLDTVRRIAADGSVPRCPKCNAVVKPDVVFFGEALPERFGDMLDVDRGVADLLIVIGTSLEVYPFAGVADMMRPGTPRVLINMERVGTFKSSADRDASVVLQDAFIQGDCQAAVQGLAADLGDAHRLSEAYTAGKAAVKP
jgi:NAD-dependent histone deacetylase SIR2